MADELRTMGVTNSQLREMGKRREVVQDIRVESPVDGVVLKRSVSPGLRFDRGFEFYRIADLNRVWILADVYRHQLPFIRRGASARITTAEAGQAHSATVSPSEPIFDEATLTLKVRLEAANPQSGAQARHVRRHGVSGRPPGDARRAGGCDRGLGAAQNGVRRQRPRLLRAAAGRDRVARRRRRRGDERAHAWRADRGLGHVLRRFREPHEGSRTRTPSAAPVLDPVCGMDVDPREAGNAGRTAAHGDHVFFFCSDSCKQQFVADPSRHAKRTVVKP